MTRAASSPAASPPRAKSEAPADGGRLPLILATACGLLIANLYYGQPLTGLIGRKLLLHPESLGLIVTLPLAGYGLGLVTLVPLGDLIENRRLVLLLVVFEIACLLVIATAKQPLLFLAPAFLLGFVAASVQLLVPYVTYVIPEAGRGQAVGHVVSGVMLGIMLARPVASLVAEHFGWEAIYRCSAVAMFVLLVVLRAALPVRQPAAGIRYRDLLRSMARIYVTVPLIRRRGIYHACLFGAFSVFWTAAPLWLGGPRFDLSQQGIGWVALAGVAGAIAPPFAGRMADRGASRLGITLAMLAVPLSFALCNLPFSSPRTSLGFVVAAAILLDFAVSANLVFSQRAIYALDAAERSRMNGLFMATFFVGGAVGSALSAWCFARFGWIGVSVLGAALPLCGLTYFASDPDWKNAKTTA